MAAGLLATAGNIQAQDLFGGDGLLTGTNGALNIVWGGIKELQPFTTNRAVDVQLGVGFNTASAPKLNDKMLYGAAVLIPVSSIAAIGVAGGYTQNNWEFGTVTFGLGITNNWQLGFISLGNVRSYVEDGPVWNFSKHSVGNYVANGYRKQWIVSKYCEIGAGVQFAYDSTRSGLDIMPGGDFQVHGANAIPLQAKTAEDHLLTGLGRGVNHLEDGVASVGETFGLVRRGD